MQKKMVAPVAEAGDLWANKLQPENVRQTRGTFSGAEYTADEKSGSISLKFSVSRKKEKKVGKPRRKTYPWTATPAVKCPVCKKLFANDGRSYRDHLPCTGGSR